MKQFNFKFTLKAQNMTEAQQKMQALSALVSSTDTPTLVALSTNGPLLLKDPEFGPIIRQFLGMSQ